MIILRPCGGRKADRTARKDGAVELDKIELR